MNGIDLTRLNKFVGMLGSEHAGEQSNAATFIKKMAVERKMNMVEFLTAAYGGGSERIVYKEKIVYRDTPGPSGTAGPARQDKPYGDFGAAYRNASRAYTENPHSRGEEIRAAEEMRRQRDRAEANREERHKPRPQRHAYGKENEVKTKIKKVLEYHSMALTFKEKEFLEGLIQKADNGYEMTPKQRAWYADIMKKVGM